MAYEEATMAYEEANEKVQMPYREKTAWLALIGMIVPYGAYFGILAAGIFPDKTLPNLPLLGLLAAVSIVRLLILGVGNLYLSRVSPLEARTPLDERDRAITQRSVSSAYYVLIAGMILVGFFLPFTSGGWTIVNTALAAIVVAEIVRYSVVVVNYRRQA